MEGQASQKQQGYLLPQARRAPHLSKLNGRPRKEESHGRNYSQLLSSSGATSRVSTGANGNSGQGPRQSTRQPLRHWRSTPLQPRPRVSTQLLKTAESDQTKTTPTQPPTSGPTTRQRTVNGHSLPSLSNSSKKSDRRRSQRPRHRTLYSN
jgi:hypothetical protein